MGTTPSTLTPREVVVFIHGVTSAKKTRHTEEYDSLHNLVRAKNQSWPRDYCGVEWGWNHSGGPTPTGHELLSSAEHALGGRALSAVHGASDFTLNPLRLAVNAFRPLMAFGFADMFYYASRQGKNSVRLAVADELGSYLKPLLSTSPATPVSLTLIGHSAGSVVAFDFLFYLFYPYPAQRSADAKVAEFLGADTLAKTETVEALKRLRDMADHGLLRVRRLFTIGSPITPLAFRSNAVLSILANGGRLDPSYHGFEKDPFTPPLSGPRWINVWDKDDPIAWPVEPLMEHAGTVVSDRYVDVSDNPGSAHGAYWGSDDVAQVIATAW